MSGEDGVTREAAADVARQLLDEAAARILDGFLTSDVSVARTRLLIEAAHGYTELARLERLPVTRVGRAWPPGRDGETLESGLLPRDPA